MTPGHSGDADIARATGMLGAGGVIIYPAETVYGFGCDPLDEAACERIQRLKGRDAAKTFLVLASHVPQVERLTGPFGHLAARLAGRFWPGPLTIVLRPSLVVPPWLIGPSGGVACRVTPDPVATALIDAFGRPVVSTSANRTGMPPLTSGNDAAAQFGGMVDMILDGGPRHGIPSTIVDVTGVEPRILRAGAIREDDLNEVF